MAGIRFDDVLALVYVLISVVVIGTLVVLVCRGTWTDWRVSLCLSLACMLIGAVFSERVFTWGFIGIWFLGLGVMRGLQNVADALRERSSGPGKKEGERDDPSGERSR